MPVENDIKTSRLFLSPMKEDEIEFDLTLENQPESYQIDAENAPVSDEVIKRCPWFIERAQLLSDKGAIRWIVRNDNLMIGEVHFTCNWETTHEWEIGYKFLKKFWGYGYATEAVICVQCTTSNKP